MAWVKKAAAVTAGVAVGLFILNQVTRRFLPAARAWFGLA